MNQKQPPSTIPTHPNQDNFVTTQAAQQVNEGRANSSQRGFQTPLSPFTRSSQVPSNNTANNNNQGIATTVQNCLGNVVINTVSAAKYHKLSQSPTYFHGSVAYPHFGQAQGKKIKSGQRLLQPMPHSQYDDHNIVLGPAVSGHFNEQSADPSAACSNSVNNGGAATTGYGGGHHTGHMAISPAEFETMTTDLKEQFQKYLRLIFTDLCAKDNGLNMRAFGFYTFQKYAKKLPGYLTSRLFQLMASERQESDFLGSSQCGANGKPQKSKNRKQILAEKERFVKVLTILYAGSPHERRTLIFRLLDRSNRGLISKSGVRVTLIHYFHIKESLSNSQTTMGSSGFAAYILYLIEKLKMEGNPFQSGKHEDDPNSGRIVQEICGNSSGQQSFQPKKVCEEALVSFNDIKIKRVGSEENSSSVPSISRQSLIDFLVDELFSSKAKSKKQNNGNSSPNLKMTHEEFLESETTQTIELVLVYYLRLLLPCSDYFENLLVDHYYKMLENQKLLREEERLNLLSNHIKSREHSILRKSGAPESTIKQQFRSDRQVAMEASSCAVPMDGSSHPKSLSQLINPNGSQPPTSQQNTPTMTPHKGPFGQWYHSQFAFNRTNPLGQNQQANNQTTGEPGYKPVQRHQYSGGFPLALAQAAGDANADITNISSLLQNSYLLNNNEDPSPFPLFNKKLVQGSQAFLFSAGANTPVSQLGHLMGKFPKFETGDSRQNLTNVPRESHLMIHVEGINAYDQTQNNKEECKSQNRTPTRSQFRGTVATGNGDLTKERSHSIDLYANVSISPMNRSGFQGAFRFRQLQQIQQKDTPIKQQLSDQRDSPEEESLQQTTTAQDADELEYQEKINIPVVYHLNSNFESMRKRPLKEHTSDLILDSGIQNFILGGQGPFARERPLQNLNQRNLAQQFQTREIFQDMLNSNKFDNSGLHDSSIKQTQSYGMFKRGAFQKSAIQLVNSRNESPLEPSAYSAERHFENNGRGSCLPNIAGLDINNAIRSIVEEEDGESFIELDDNFESIKQNHREAILNCVSVSQYFSKLYRKIVMRRHEERKNVLDLSYLAGDGRLEQPSWEVFFKIPEMSSTKMKRFFIKIEGNDIYCVHDPREGIDTPKLKFLHCLLGCSFLIKPPETDAALRSSISRTKVVQKGGFAPENNSSNGGEFTALTSPCYQIQIKLSEKHKRVFYVKTQEQADEIVKRMKQAADIRELEDQYLVNVGGTGLNQSVSENSGLPQNVLGQGTYGKVFKAYSKKTREAVAVKQIQKKSLILEELMLQQYEIQLYKILTDDSLNPLSKSTRQETYIPRILDVFEDHQQLSIVLEYVEGYNLFHWIKQEKNVNENKTKKLFMEIMKAAEYTHSKGIVHRDIKLENIMLETSNTDTTNSNIKIKLIDFGLSKVLLPTETSLDPYGTLAYCSPEIIAKKPHSTQTDIWSLGIVLYALLSRRMPFVVAHDTELTKSNILQRQLNFESAIWQTVSAEGKDLISKMLEKEARMRPNAEQVLKHRWFTEE